MNEPQTFGRINIRSYLYQYVLYVQLLNQFQSEFNE